MLNKFKNEILYSPDIENKISEITNNIKVTYTKDDLISHIHKYPIPSKETVISIIKDFFDLIYPGYFVNKDLSNSNIQYFVGSKVSDIIEKLSGEIAKSFRHNHIIKNNVCELCDESIEKGTNTAVAILSKLPDFRKILLNDVNAAFTGDPAAKGYNEIVFSYPGLFAITIHRIAHELYKMDIPLIPRIMSEYSHSRTGIDIHPGATIGEYFFIDHGTGVVIGETCNIGNHVKIYQGVTLGALSFPKDESGEIIKGLQRHPTIEDNVTIYSGATILGGDTVIGKNSIIGGNVWIVKSIPPDSKVLLADIENKIIVKTKSNPE